MKNMITNIYKQFTRHKQENGRDKQKTFLYNIIVVWSLEKKRCRNSVKER